jgi:hypothetical protein
MGTYILLQACCITIDFRIKMNAPCAVNHTSSMELVAEETVVVVAMCGIDVAVS